MLTTQNKLKNVLIKLVYYILFSYYTASSKQDITRTFYNQKAEQSHCM